jgi:hypothetical protein
VRDRARIVDRGCNSAMTGAIAAQSSRPGHVAFTRRAQHHGGMARPLAGAHAGPSSSEQKENR